MATLFERGAGPEETTATGAAQRAVHWRKAALEISGHASPGASVRITSGTAATIAQPHFDCEAAWRLGRMLERGGGDPLELWRQAASGGHAGALHSLAQRVEEAGDASLALGVLPELAVEEGRLSPEVAAFQLFKAAADSGRHPEAMHSVAIAYHQVVPRGRIMGLI